MASHDDYEDLRSYVPPRHDRRVTRDDPQVPAGEPDPRISIMDWLVDVGQAALLRFRRPRPAR